MENPLKKNVEKSNEESSYSFCLDDFLFMELDIEEYDEILSVWILFELKFKDVLENGEEVLEFLI